MRPTKPPDPNAHLEWFNEITDHVLDALATFENLERSQTQTVQEDHDQNDILA